MEDDWTESLTVLEHCVTASLTLEGFEEVAINCLTAITLEEKLRSWSSGLVVRVVRFTFCTFVLLYDVNYVNNIFIRFHLGIIFLRDCDISFAADKCIDNIISILISSYLNTKENATIPSKKSCGNCLKRS